MLFLTLNKERYLAMSTSNNIKWDYTNEIRKPIKNGTILLSEPFMEDDLFKRSVCLICDHNGTDGTFGFLINRNTEQKVCDLVDDLTNVDAFVYYGGPVANDSLYYIHTNLPPLNDAHKISDNLYWGGDFEQLKVLLKNNEIDLKTIKFVVGYSGWDPNQLRKEIIENSWIVNNEINEEMVFSQSKYLWHETMQSMGGIYKTMATFPEQPDLN